MGKNDRKKSVFLFGKPTKNKLERLIETEQAYTNLMNRFIKEMANDSKYYLDLMNNNKQAPKIRALEKSVRHTHQLGSAYGQNAIDQAISLLHNHFMQIKNNLYGYIFHHDKGIIPYVSFISLLNASVQDENELAVLRALQQSTKNKQAAKTYENAYMILSRLTEEQRTSKREYIRALFYDKLDHWKLPFVHKATLQLDSRVSKIEKSHSTTEDFVVSLKLLNEKKYVEIPVSTSENSLRRLNQYKNGSMTAKVVNGKVKIGIPFTKKVNKRAQEELLGIDQGITDLFYTSNHTKYGSFSGMVHVYEGSLEKKLGNRSSLRNKLRAYQKQLKKTDNQFEKELLRKKIKHIADNLNGKKSLQKERRRYHAVVDYEISQAVKRLFEEITTNSYLPVFEDLDIVKFDRGKKANKRDSFWIRGKLMRKITAKLDWHGYHYKTVDPAYTSKMCGKCHHVDEDNRKGKTFTCTVCKYKADADYNASVVIKNRALDTEITAIVEKYKNNTKKRHKELRELLYKRHCSYMKKVQFV
ncbi:zinc ribbon domain-containing protein [Oceanobacillus oncorhynchi]|uniref:zinc ribbon domain-containing protein n=1 Tax=Oceanobacillus oncorhynchi TaxID=545501 RepID=UPI0021165568|nr:zinc ribbon domain-containing protein [Oceanobacillus oncorhynchi]UUI40560.1 zinc ribbon domain-containing protein [Oceanobacillus oncorhynchi]